MELPTLPPDYKPEASEEYMNPMQLAYFRQKLNDHKSELMGMTHETLEDMKNQGGVSSPELTDRATAETDWAGSKRVNTGIVKKLASPLDSSD